MRGRSETYDPQVQLNSSSKPHGVRIPSNIMIPFCHFVHVVCSYHASEADNEPHSEKMGNYDALPKWKVQVKNNWDWDKYNTEVV